jgi:hypothetical protein
MCSRPTTTPEKTVKEEEDILLHNSNIVDVYRATSGTAAKRKALLFEEAALLEDKSRIVQKRENFLGHQRRNDEGLVVHCNAVAVHTPPASTNVSGVASSLSLGIAQSVKSWSKNSIRRDFSHSRNSQRWSQKA